MISNNSNIILIGMPGSGKSTVGVILAKLTSKGFIDGDVLIQTTEGKTLQEIVNEDGHMELRRIEERVLLSINCDNHVISPGGSAAYSSKAMNYLRSNGIVVFLHTDLETLRTRIKNYETRGLAKGPDQTFDDLFRERMALYTEYADITVETSRKTQEEVAEEILRLALQQGNNL